jgi:acetyl esterase
MMVKRLACIVLLLAQGAQAADRADTFRPTPEEQARLELMSRQEEWFLKNLASPRELIDGQLLDPKLQYYLEERRRRTPEAVQRGLAMFDNAEERVIVRNRLAREWALFTKVTAPMRSVEDREIDGPRGKIPIRIYVPEVNETGPLPILVYFHGGGWLYSGIEATDRTVRLIANEARVIVVNVEYALAPEHPWPAANDDGEAAFLWVRENAASLGGHPDLIGVGGDSAGGNISLIVSQRQIAAGRPTPLYQLLYYTAASFSMSYRSAKLFAEGYSLDTTFREFMLSRVYPGEGTLEKATKELQSLDLKRMPATIIVTAGFDMLRDAGRNLARELERNGVSVTYLNYPTLIHGFLQWSAVVPDAERAAVDTARLFGTAIRSRLPLLRQTAVRE